MKKGTIIALIVAAALIFTGGIILILGLSYAGTGEDPLTLLTQNEHTIPEAFDSILIKTEDCNVDFVLYEGNADPHVVIMERESASHRVEVKDGVLRIEMMDNRSWRDFIGVHWEQMEMTVYLPQKQYESVRIYTATGYIQIPEVFSIREAGLQSATGWIVCDANVTDSLSCDTATGAITVRNAAPAAMRLDSNTGRIQVANAGGGEIGLENDTGRTELENVSCALLACESETGDVNVRSVMVEDYLQVFTDTGDVLIENSDAGRVNIETDTGDVSGNFLTPKDFSWACSDTGKVVVPNTRDGGQCRIETDTGDIRFFYEDIKKIQ